MNMIPRADAKAHLGDLVAQAEAGLALGVETLSP